MNQQPSYAMSEWEADLNQLLARWPVTAPFEDLDREIDAVLERRFPDSPHAERFARRLIVAMSFLWHRRQDSAIDDFLIVGVSSSVVKPALARALFRVLTAMPDDRLGEPLNSDQIIALMAEDCRE